MESIDRASFTWCARRWLEFEVKSCSLLFSRCRHVNVVSVSGTDISRIADYTENLRMPRGAFQRGASLRGSRNHMILSYCRLL